MPATPKPDDLSPSTLAADWQRMKSEMAPKLDTSPAAVARVLREVRKMCASLAAYIEMNGELPPPEVFQLSDEADALADALDQQAAEAPYGRCDCGRPYARPYCSICDNDE